LISSKFILHSLLAFDDAHLPTMNKKRLFWKVWLFDGHHVQSLNVIASVGWIIEKTRNILEIKCPGLKCLLNWEIVDWKATHGCD